MKRFILLALCSLMGLSSLAFASSTDVELNKATVQRFLGALGKPEAQTIVKEGHFPGVLADDVWGRVVPVGDFVGAEDSVEYFFGISQSPGNGHTAIDNLQVNSLFGEGDVVFVNCVITWIDTNTKQVYLKAAAEGRFRFNDQGLIQSYDLNVINLGKIGWKLAMGLDELPGYMQLPVKIGLCVEIQSACKDANAVYNDLGDCINAMNERPLGDFSNTRSNSVVCRALHVKLAGVRPEVHCAHVARDGGGKCIDVPYDDYFKFSLYEKPVENHQHKQMLVK